MKGYWIILATEIRDPQAQQAYAQRWKPIADKYGAALKLLDACVLKEQSHSSRVIAAEFPSYAQAKACYEDPAYADAKIFALSASNRELLIIEGDLA